MRVRRYCRCPAAMYERRWMDQLHGSAGRVLLLPLRGTQYVILACCWLLVCEMVECRTATIIVP